MTQVVLAFDTATDHLAMGVGLRGGDQLSVLRSVSIHSPRKANTILLETVRDGLHAAELSIRDVSEVVVGRGPGSFTGVRIGVATAKGIAQGLGVPLYGVGTLDAVAWNFTDDEAIASGALLGVVGDAMRGEVYPALFRLVRGGFERLTEDAVGDPRQVAEAWAESIEGPLVLAGNGLAKYADIFADALGERAVLSGEHHWAPEGRGLLSEYAAARGRDGLGSGEPGALLPVYTRLSDAEENELARLGLPREEGLPSSGVAGEHVRPGPSPSIRPMTPDDVEEVLEIERASFSDAWTRGMFLEELSANRRAWYVMEDESGVIGYGGAAILADEAHVMNLAIQEDRRRQGLGRRMLMLLRETAMEYGAGVFTLEVRERNTAAIALYESVGMTVAGLRPRYYSDTKEDAIIMWAQLPAMSVGASMASDPAYESGRPVEETLILAIETSCDETAAAVIRGDAELLANVVASQVDFHARFGGVVPEIASRKHTEAVVGVVQDAMERAGGVLGSFAPLPFAQLDAIAVTQGPGLVGALVVGLAYAKGLSYGTGVPLVGVNHLEGHIFANILSDPEIAPPLVALVVSGGHTSLVHMPDWGEYHTLGETLDDAAGEAFDKVAKVLGLGYPGGPVISKLAEQGDPAAIDFPRAMLRSGDYRFSLSGLKTAVINYIRHEQEAGREIDLRDLAASFQAAVIDVQVSKAVRAVEETGARAFCLAGGVAANPSLREALREAIEPLGVRVSVPPFQLCTDNAAMIAAAAHHRFLAGERLDLGADAKPGLRLDTH